jgi:hypothetical protein
MNRRLLNAIIIAALISGALLGGILLTPRTMIRGLLSGPVSDTSALSDRASQFVGAIRANDSRELYRLFNSTFRHEISQPRLDSSLTAWRRGRVIERVFTTHQEIRGSEGMVSTSVYFVPTPDRARPAPARQWQRSSDYEFLFQYWVRGSEGWQLMWISGLLDPIGMDYGRQDTASFQSIVELALEEIIVNEGLDSLFGISDQSRRVVLVSHTGLEPGIQLKHHTVVWVPQDSILTNPVNRRIGFYVDVQPLRILSDIAIGTFDIVPILPGDRTVAGPRRSIKLFFVREKGRWRFADYGSKW